MKESRHEEWRQEIKSRIKWMLENTENTTASSLSSDFKKLRSDIKSLQIYIQWYEEEIEEEAND